MKKGYWQWYATLFFFHDMSSICIYGYGSVCNIALFSHVHYVWIYTCISSVENGLMIDFVLVNVEGVRICFKTWLQIFGSFWFICLLTLFIGFFLLLISVSYETEKKKKHEYVLIFVLLETACFWVWHEYWVWKVEGAISFGWDLCANLLVIVVVYVCRHELSFAWWADNLCLSMINYLGNRLGYNIKMNYLGLDLCIRMSCVKDYFFFLLFFFYFFLSIPYLQIIRVVFSGFGPWTRSILLG
jgi:hypothetical protein